MGYQNSAIKNLFKAYDIRGLSPKELNPSVAYAIARAFADFLPAGKIAVGHDMRKDSQELSEAFMTGLIKQGREVLDLGLVTSDMVYYAVGKYKLAGGAMITASHNPKGYDGIKLTGKNVVPIGIDSGLLSIEEEVETKHFKSNKSKHASKITDTDITKEWVEHAISLAGEINKPLKVGMDTGNGMAGIVVPYMQNLLPIKIDSIYTELDGSFPNHPANPLDPKNNIDLQKLVLKNNLDCGIAFDGDGDRAFFVDDLGHLLSSSVIGAIIARDMLESSPGETILYSAVCSDILPATIESFGGRSARVKVGHSYIKAQMRKRKAAFAAEHSGHFYYKDNYFADSGIITALKILNILSRTGKKLSEIATPYTNMFANSEELNFEFNNQEDTQDQLLVLERHFSDGDIDHLEGLTVRYRDWWFNARTSNTEPYLRLNIEADNTQILDKQQKYIARLLKKYS
ncbi:MAG: phosphomannomutase [Patescibacteria group bacterium]|jgi:phosphomannomutase|nr:phosphomannomutase [Patescibacteria group bacterium]